MVSLYVEGGGRHHSKLRRGFRAFLEKAGFEGRCLKVIACGSRQEAYKDYRLAVEQSKSAVLLVDSESPVSVQLEEGDIFHWKPWGQLESDGWSRVGTDTDCHLMVQVMETWFLTDIEAVKAYYKSGSNKFSSVGKDIEKIAKKDVYNILADIAKSSSKGEYDKGRDSFEILGKINPSRVRKYSRWADRFLVLLKEKMDDNC